MIILATIGYPQINHTAIVATMLNWLEKEPWAHPFYASEITGPDQKIEIFMDCSNLEAVKKVEDCMHKLGFDFRINSLKRETLAVCNPFPKTGTIDGTPIPEPEDNPQSKNEGAVPGF